MARNSFIKIILAFVFLEKIGYTVCGLFNNLEEVVKTTTMFSLLLILLLPQDVSATSIWDTMHTSIIRIFADPIDDPDIYIEAPLKGKEDEFEHPCPPVVEEKRQEDEEAPPSLEPPPETVEGDPDKRDVAAGPVPDAPCSLGPWSYGALAVAGIAGVGFGNDWGGDGNRDFIPDEDSFRDDDDTIVMEPPIPPDPGVPEPGALLLFAVGILLIIMYTRRRRRRA